MPMSLSEDQYKESGLNNVTGVVSEKRSVFSVDHLLNALLYLIYKEDWLRIDPSKSFKEKIAILARDRGRNQKSDYESINNKTD